MLSSTYRSTTPYENENKAMCRAVQRDPYAHLQTNVERILAKQWPVRIVLNSAFMAFAAFYYVSRHNELNRLMRLKISIDLMINVGTRVALAGVASDLLVKKLFLNKNRVTCDKVARNEVKKIMTTFPNAKTLLKPHEKPNSYYWA